jgi:hypothetical protein
VWNNGGMILTGESNVLGEKILHSMDGNWVNEYGAIVE